MVNYDDWLTSDPDDREYCETHEAVRPCYECRAEAAEFAMEYDHENNH